MKIALKILSILFFYSVLVFSQTSDETVAVVGDKSISVDEFQFRYELTPQMFREQGIANVELKQEFLYTLIAEKLLASYGELISLDTSDAIRQTLRAFEEMFVRDELYKRMIVEKAKFKADSLMGFYIANSTNARLTYIRTNRYDEAERISELLKKGVPFDFFYSDTSHNVHDTLSITFGQFDEYIENEILTLSENSFSKPLFINNRWYILNVIKKYYPVIERTTGWESEYKRLKKLAKERAEMHFYKDFTNSIFANLNIKANGKSLKLFADEIYDILSAKRLKHTEQKKYFLEVSDFALIQNRIGKESLNSTFVKLPGAPISLKEFINFFRFEKLSFDSISHQNVLDILNGKTRKFIEYKILAGEGYRYGLEKTSQVKKQYNMWKQNYFYQLVMAEFADSAFITDNEVKTYYNQMNKGRFKVREFNITEVIVHNPETAEKVLAEIESGKDIRELAADSSIKMDESELWGESGFKPISYFKEIGSVLEKMKIGEIYGPMKVAKGYSIFKLIDVREDSSFNEASFEQIKQEFGNELRHLKMKNSVNQFIAKLAKQHNIIINKELLNSIPTTTHNSVVFKLLGFGSKITAVPLISPNSDWVEPWLNSLKVVP